MANGRSADHHIVSACPIEAQFVVPLSANVMLVFVSLAIVLPEAYGADVEEVVESSAIAAGA